jgi:putative ABC transport system substrate-binding protein
MRRIGALIGGEQGDPLRQLWLAEFRNAFARLGWIEGKSIWIDWRWAAGDSRRAVPYANELVAQRPDVLFGDNTFVVAELQKAGHSLPIVFAKVNDPILSGFASNLARPDGNITGFADAEPASLTKLPEFLKQLAPQINSVVVVTGLPPTGRTEGIVNAASSIGLRASVVLVRNAREIEDAMAGFAREPNSGLILPGDPLLAGYRSLIVQLVAQYRLPATYGNLWWAPEGALLCYGTKSEDQYRGAASYIDRILKGASPEELPIQAPTKYELIVNLRTARALGLTVPLTLQVVADEVIE